MVCKICGKQLPDGSSVCKYCGAKQRNPIADSGAPRRYSKKGIARRRMINSVLLGVVALLIVGIIAGIVMSARSIGDSGKTEENKETIENTENTENKDEETDDKTTVEDEEKDDKSEESEEDAASKEDEEAEEPDEAEESEDPDASGETGESDESEEPDASAETEEPDESEKPDTETSAPAVTAPTGNYTASISRKTVDASLNHYRILTVSINETLPAGVEVASVTFTSSDNSIVRPEVVDGEGRAWGVALGKATVTGTVTLSTGETASASCEVTVVEYKEPEEPKDSSDSSSDSSSSSSSGYVLPNSSSRVYSVSELNKLSDKQLRLARNEIYARHGRIFNDPELQKYFESKSWYKGTVSPDKFDDSVLNATEKKNITNIQKAESD